jgi:PilZ domain-containing protein
MDNERRNKSRFPVELTVHYQTLELGPSISGAGRTVNVSSGGVLMTAEQGIHEGARIKITMEWPSLLNGITPLQLVTTGKVVRSQDLNVGVEFDWYQFRTMRRNSEQLPALAAKAAAATATNSVKSLNEPLRLRNAV